MKNIILIIVVIAALGFLYTQYKKSLTQPKTDINKNEVFKNTKHKNLAIPDGVYELITQGARLHWKGETVIKKHLGTINFSSSEISVVDGKISGFAIVDMSSISGDAGDTLNNHLKSSDFFDVENYPESKITFIQNNDSSFDAYLTVRGIEMPVDFNPVISIADGILSLDSKLSFDRTNYGVMYSSAKIADTLKDKIINDTIVISTELKFMNKKTA